MAEHGIPVIDLNTIIAGMRDGVTLRCGEFVDCADCRKDGPCPDHQEDCRKAESYELIIAVLEGGDAAGLVRDAISQARRNRGAISKAELDEIATHLLGGTGGH